MLIPREELRFDFGAARFDVENPRDRRWLGWIFNQFLYGEVTGIQCGYWLYNAPHLQAAAFLAKQAGEEIAHVRRILRILSLLGERPAQAHWAIRFLSSGMMGATWGEHVGIEMALGEGLVLTVFYAMAETIPHEEIQKILESATVEEERHVEFGERETQAWLLKHPEGRPVLLAQALIQLWALGKLRGFVRKWLGSEGAAHPVLGQFDAFYGHVVAMFAVRIDRLGLSDRPLREMGLIEKISLVVLLPFRKWLLRRRARERKLTTTYLNDPVVRAELERS